MASGAAGLLQAARVAGAWAPVVVGPACQQLDGVWV
jgi:hypothetical protein